MQPAQRAESRGRLRRLLAGRRLPVRRRVVLGLMVGCSGTAYGALMLFQYWQHPDDLDWVHPAFVLVSSLLGALLGASLVRWGRHPRLGEAERARRRTFDTAARTGRLPADIDATTWLPLLAERQRVQRRRTVITLVVLTVVAVVLLVLVLLATDAFSSALFLWAVVFLQAMNWTWASGERRQRRLAAMMERLSARARGDQTKSRG